MKVYFAASLTGKKKFDKEYRLIIDALKELKFQVVGHVLASPAEEGTKNEGRLIKSVDFLVAEISFPSVSVGQEISLALEAKKPVLALHSKKVESTLLEINANENLRIVSYDNRDLKKVLRENLTMIVGKTDVRFNFFVPPQIIDYLDWVAKEKRVPRSVYLRNLIEKEMKEDSQYGSKKAPTEEK